MKDFSDDKIHLICSSSLFNVLDIRKAWSFFCVCCTWWLQHRLLCSHTAISPQRWFCPMFQTFCQSLTTSWNEFSWDWLLWELGKGIYVPKFSRQFLHFFSVLFFSTFLLLKLLFFYVVLKWTPFNFQYFSLLSNVVSSPMWYLGWE